MTPEEEATSSAWGVHARGLFVEPYLAGYCMLASLGRLRVSKSFIDDEGIDLVFNRWGSTATLALQVKARFTNSAEVERGDFVADVGRSNFQPRVSFYVLFAVVDPHAVRLEPLWLVPSLALQEKNQTKKEIRFKANIKMAGKGTGQWEDFVVPTLADLPERLISILNELESAAEDQ